MDGRTYVGCVRRGSRNASIRVLFAGKGDAVVCALNNASAVVLSSSTKNNLSCTAVLAGRPINFFNFYGTVLLSSNVRFFSQIKNRIYLVSAKRDVAN